MEKEIVIGGGAGDYLGRTIGGSNEDCFESQLTKLKVNRHNITFLNHSSSEIVNCKTLDVYMYVFLCTCDCNIEMQLQ